MTTTTHSLVSVVIPTYNREAYIARAIDSALGQTHRNVEVIVVDDGSTDSTGRLIARRYVREARVHYLHQPNRGVAAARNAGLREVRGDYIALLDSDDIWKPWKLELQIACLERLPQAGMIWTDMEAIGPDGKVFNPYFLRTMYYAYQRFSTDDLFTESFPLPAISMSLPEWARLYVGDIYSPMIMGNLVHTSTVLLRRDRFEKVKTFNEELRPVGEDYDFHLRTCREGPVAFINLAAIAYQKGIEDQLTEDRYAIHVARNFLNTISPAIERDRERIQLPDRMIRTVLSDASRWIGEAAFDIGGLPEARRHLFRSLRLKMWQPHTAALLLVSLLPIKFGRAVRTLYQVVKRSARELLAGGRKA